MVDVKAKDEETGAPSYPQRRRPDVRRMFLQSSTPLSESMRAEARQVAARVFQLDRAETGPVGKGDHLGDYRIQRVLGAGGQAFVYEAEHTQLGRKVAIKVPRKDVAERLLREARISARLEHPRVVRVEHVGEHEGPTGTIPYLVFELQTGGSLDDLLEQHPDGLPLGEVKRIGSALLEALAYAHERGVVHRDVKPSNVLFDAQGEPKLADLGIGTLATGPELDHTIDVSNLTEEGVALGTPLFMAPEQENTALQGSDGIDGRADLFSFGKMLFVMLTGASPRTIRPPSRLRPELDARWDDLVFSLVEEDRHHRPSSAEAVLATLRDLPSGPLRVRVRPSESSEELPAIRVAERGVVPVARAVEEAPAEPPVGFLVPPGSDSAAWIYTLAGLASGAFAGYLGWLASFQSWWIQKELLPLIVGSGLAAVLLLFGLRGGEKRTSRSLGPFLAAVIVALLAGWEPLAFLGRFVWQVPGLKWMPHPNFIGVGWVLCAATFVTAGITLARYARHRRGEETAPRVVARPRGGVPGERSMLVAYLLWATLGWLGIHRFYLGRPISGLIWFFTGGLVGIGWLLDALLTYHMVEVENTRAQIAYERRRSSR